MTTKKFYIVNVTRLKNIIYNYIKRNNMDISISAFLTEHIHISHSAFHDMTDRYNKHFGTKQACFGLISDYHICKIKSVINIDDLFLKELETKDKLLINIEVVLTNDNKTKLKFKLANSNVPLVEYTLDSLNATGLEKLVDLLK